MVKISKLLVNEDNLHLVKTNKYKDINIYIKYAFKYKDKLKASLAVLSLMLEDRTEKYNTKEKLTKAKDMLYGLNYGCSIANVHDVLTLTFNYSFTNPYFLKANIKDYIDFIDETVKRPFLTEQSFVENKKILIDSINRKLDNPSKLALNSFYKEVAKDDKRILAFDDDLIADINILTLEEIKNTYNSLFNTRVDIYLIGDYCDELKDYLKNYNSNANILIDNYPLNIKKDEYIVKTRDVSQSTLIVSFSSPYTVLDNDYYAYHLGVVLFGGTASSLLFQNVREKLSLCYSIYSRPIKSNGLMYVLTNIDKDNKDKTLNEIFIQREKIINNDYDLNLVDVAKKMIFNNYNLLDDDLDFLVDFTYTNLLSNIDSNIDALKNKISKVNANDIASAFKNLNSYITFFLEGTKDAKDKQ